MNTDTASVVDRPSWHKWVALFAGYGLLGVAIFAAVSAFSQSDALVVWEPAWAPHVAVGFVAVVGAFGWFLAGLLMSPRIRRDLFGSRFD